LEGLEISNDLKDIVFSMLRYNVDERITLKDVIKRQQIATTPIIDQSLLIARNINIFLFFLVDYSF
jgi:hypothetical protein